MHATIRAFWLPKAGNSASDYEDAFWPRKPLDQTSHSIRMAVGDGATETSFSAHWARLLVRDYGSGRLTPGSIGVRLPSLQRRWRRQVGKRPLPWYAEAKLSDGAFSSLAGLTVEDERCETNSDGRWEAMVIGDSCLFQIRDMRMITSFPLGRSEEFDSRPSLIPSVESSHSRLDDDLRAVGGRCRPGDLFYLMTDALACWLLWMLEGDEGNILNSLDQIQTQADFEEIVRDQRKIRLSDGTSPLKNDDVTLLRCRIDQQ